MAVNKRLRRRKIRYRIRKKIIGTASRPRLSVFRSNKSIYAQLIDDSMGSTIVTASSLEKDVASKQQELNKSEVSKLVGELLASRAIEKGIESVVFDRGGYLYHGRVKALAEGAREKGLVF